MKNLYTVIILIVTLMFFWCTAKTPDPKVLERDNVSAIANTADLQMTFIKKHGEIDRYCGPRQSDIADTRSSGATLGGSALGDAGNVGEGSSEGALSLGGRSPSVLIVREMLYRACELSMNLNTDTKTTIEIYSKFLESIEKITATQTGTGVVALGQKANTTVNMTENGTKASSTGTTTGTNEDVDEDN